MEGKILISPRQSWKTYTLTQKCIINSRSILIVRSNMERNLILENNPKLNEYKIFSVTDLPKFQDAISPEILYIDEYLFFKEKDKRFLYRYINSKEFDYIEVRTTANKLYEKNIIDLMRYLRSLNLPFNYLNNYILKKYSDYHYNLLTMHDFEIITNVYWENILDPEQFDIAILGKLFKD